MAKKKINWISIVCGAAVVITIFLFGFMMRPFLNVSSRDLSSPPLETEIARFTKSTGSNSLGFEFRVFNDNEFNGTSQVSFSVVKASDPYMKLDYYLPLGDPKSQYCGVDTHFSPEPYSLRDASSYRGISFRVRWKPSAPPEPTASSEVELYLQVGDPRPTVNAFLEKFIGLEPDSDWQNKEILFVELQSPWWDKEGTPVPLNPAKLFKIAFLLRGSNAYGSFEFDDIQFYK